MNSASEQSLKLELKLDKLTYLIIRLLFGFMIFGWWWRVEETTCVSCSRSFISSDILQKKLIGSLNSINGLLVKLGGLFKGLGGRTLELVAHQSTGPHEPPIDRPRLHKLMVVKIVIEPLEGDHPSNVMR